jgi:hypothetical protein
VVGLTAGRECLDDDQLAAATRTRPRQDARLFGLCCGRVGVLWACGHGEQLARPRDVGGASGLAFNQATWERAIVSLKREGNALLEARW